MECKNIADWQDKSLPEKDTRRQDIGIFLTKTDGDHAPKPWEDLDVGAGPTYLNARSYVARNSHAHVAILGEVLLVDPPFGDAAEDEFLISTDGGAKTCAQMCDHVGKAMAPLHRTFMFTFVIYRTSARFIRWDRVGAVVSRSIDLKTEYDTFFEGFWRMARLTDVQLGFESRCGREKPKPAKLRY